MGGYYQPGTEVFTHLTWDAEQGAYETSWWNAVGAIDPNRKYASFPAGRDLAHRFMRLISTDR